MWPARCSAKHPSAVLKTQCAFVVLSVAQKFPPPKKSRSVEASQSSQTGYYSKHHAFGIGNEQKRWLQNKKSRESTIPGHYNVIKPKTLQAKRKLSVPLSTLPVYSMVRYLGKTFCNSSPELVRLRGLAQRISSKQGVCYALTRLSPLSSPA